MAMQVLNFDIIYLIIKHLDSYDALALSTICKAIHSIIVRHVLSSEVILGTPKEVSKFPDFLFADAPKRLPLLRSLSVTVDAFAMDDYYVNVYSVFDLDDEESLQPFRDFASFLTQVLTQSRHLKALCLDLSGYFFEQYPELRAAFIKYDGLTELKLYDVTEEVIPVVKDMHSSLRAITLQYPLESEAVDFPSFLSCMTTHRRLQQVRLGEVERQSFQLDDEAHITWPEVRTLQICGMVTLDPLVKAFPNVRSVEVEWLVFDSSPDISPFQWTSLEYLNGKCEDIHQWTLRCPVRWLDITDAFQRNDCSSATPDGGSYLSNVLDRTQPMILTISARQDIGPGFWEILASRDSQIKLLELTVNHYGLLSLTEEWIVSLFYNHDSTSLSSWTVHSSGGYSTFDEAASSSLLIHLFQSISIRAPGRAARRY